MNMQFPDLDSMTRRCALTELAHDIEGRSLFVSARLSPWGRRHWGALLDKALAEHDETWLAEELARSGWLNTQEQVSYDGGRTRTWRRMPSDAAAKLAELEFNRFVMRGVCARAVAEGVPYVRVYRARPTPPRAEVAARLGTAFVARDLLPKLRSRTRLEDLLGIPNDFSSGLSVRLSRPESAVAS